jgi:mycothiol synthase
MPVDAAYSSRPLVLDDAPEVTGVVAAAERAEPADENFTLEEIREELTLPGVELRRHSVGWFEGVTLVGYGMLHIRPSADVWTAYLSGAVHPAHQRRGLGSAIVSELADRARELRDQAQPTLPGELKIWIPSTRTGTAAMSTALGFETWRWYYRMRRPLDVHVPPPHVPSGIELRAYRPGDEEAVRLARNASFADHWGSTPTDPEHWHATFEASPSFRPSLSRVAVAEDGTVAAFVMILEFAGDTEFRGYRTAWVQLVGTVREARRAGLASALLLDSLADQAADGYRYSELGVDAESPTGAGRIYERLGFVTIERNREMGRRF